MKSAVVEQPVQWQVSVSRDTDTEARDYLRSQGLQESDVSALVEDAVGMYLFQRTVHDIQERNAGSSSEELQNIADQAVRSVRTDMHLNRV